MGLIWMLMNYDVERGDDDVVHHHDDSFVSLNNNLNVVVY